MEWGLPVKRVNAYSGRYQRIGCPLVAQAGGEVAERMAGAGDVPRLQLVEPHRVGPQPQRGDDRRDDQDPEQEPPMRPWVRNGERTGA
jgi:hypothetical protein